jgi:phosphohistidine phosphatase SixA
MFSDLLLPAGTADSIVSTIVENYLADELLIVGHEPCLGLLISLLAAANLDLAINIKKGGVCCLSTDDLRVERRATLEWLLTPKILLKG